MVYEGLCQTQKGQVLSHQKNFCKKAIPSSINVNGQDFHIHIFGQGSEAILLAHGWESNSWRWRKLMRYLGTENTSLSPWMHQDTA